MSADYTPLFDWVREREATRLRTKREPFPSLQEWLDARIPRSAAG